MLKVKVLIFFFCWAVFSPPREDVSHVLDLSSIAVVLLVSRKEYIFAANPRKRMDLGRKCPRRVLCGPLFLTSLRKIGLRGFPMLYIIQLALLYNAADPPTGQMLRLVFMYTSYKTTLLSPVYRLGNHLSQSILRFALWERFDSSKSLIRVIPC